MLHASRLRQKMTERSAYLFKTTGGQEFTVHVINLHSELQTFFLEKSFELNFLVAHSFLLIGSPSNKEPSYGEEQGPLRFGSNLWRRQLIPTFFPYAPRVVALLLLHRAQSHLCLNRLVGKKNALFDIQKSVAATSIFFNRFS